MVSAYDMISYCGERVPVKVTIVPSKQEYVYASSKPCNNTGVYTSSFYRKQRALVEELRRIGLLSPTRSGISHRRYEKLVLHSPSPQKHLEVIEY